MRLQIKTKEITNFLCLINNSVTVGLSFLLLSISALILSNAINIFRFLLRFYSSIFLWISSQLFDHSIKAFESLKYFKPVLFLLLISNWYSASYGSLS